jgi:hypothetical protein
VRDIRTAKDAQGLLSLIESRTEMQYGEFDYGAQGDPAIAPDVGIEDDEDQAE